MANPEVVGVPSEVLRGDAVGDTLYSERWILSQLIKLTKFIAGEEEFTSEFETDLCTLWDMCAEEDVIAYGRKHGLIALAVNAIMKSQSPRLSEILVGIIGNMCSSKAVREECKRRADVIRVMMELLAFPDGPTLIQVMRVLQTFAWEVSNSSFPSPNGRESNDGEQIDNDHNEADYQDYQNDYSPMHINNGEEEEEVSNDHDAIGNIKANISQNLENDSHDTSGESSLSDNMEEEIPPAYCEGIKGHPNIGNLVNEKTNDLNKNTGGKEEIDRHSPNLNITAQFIDNSEKSKNIESSSAEEEKQKLVKEPVIPCILEANMSEHGVIELKTVISDVPEPSDMTVTNTVGSDTAGSSAGSIVCMSKPGGSGDCGSNSSGKKILNDGDDDDDDDDDNDVEDENPEVVAVSVADNSVISSTAILWYEQFLKVENWVPEMVYILSSSKNDELISQTWSLLSILCYIKVGNTYLCCNISGPDMMRGLLESFKEFFGQHADVDNSEIYNISKCRKGLIAWTSVMYSFTFHEDCENSCCVFKADIVKNVFQMLNLFNNFLPLDGDLHEYLIHSFTLLDHILMTEPYELSSLRWGINGVMQLLDDLTEEKQKQERENNSTRYEYDAIDTTERYLMNVLIWLNRLHNANQLGEYEDVRHKLMARFG